MKFIVTEFRFEKNEKINYRFIEEIIKEEYVSKTLPERDGYALMIYANTRDNDALDIITELKSLGIPYKEDFNEVVKSHLILASNKKYRNNDLEVYIKYNRNFENPILKSVAKADHIETDPNEKYVVKVFYTRNENNKYYALKEALKYGWMLFKSRLNK